jgi:hypothetical protein
MELIGDRIRITNTGDYDAFFSSTAGFYGLEGVEQVFASVFYIPQLASWVDVTPSVSTVRVIGSQSVEEDDPFVYDHRLRADGWIRAIAIPGKLPEEEWDY